VSAALPKLAGSLFSIPSRFDLLRFIRLESLASSCNKPTTVPGAPSSGTRLVIIT
jgi:hypothetical protein